MNSLSEVSFIEFQKALTPEKVRSFRVIHLGLGLGVFGFSLVLLYLWFVQGADQSAVPSDVDLIVIMSGVHAVLAMTLGSLSVILYKKQFRSGRLKELAAAPLRTPEGEQVEDPVEKCLSLIRIASILRLAMLEAVALFGLIVCTIAVVNGVLPEHSMVALNAVSPAGFLLFVLASFPTAERIGEMFRTNIAQSVS